MPQTDDIYEAIKRCGSGGFELDLASASCFLIASSAINFLI